MADKSKRWDQTPIEAGVNRWFAYGVLFFLIAPLLVVIPLSFNAEPYFSFTDKMLTLQPDGFSLRWYRDIAENPQWLEAMRNSVIIGLCSTALATVLGTLAAMGLARSNMPFRDFFMALLISPLIVPIVISAAGMYFFYSTIGLAQTTLGIILAHTALGVPFVVITMTATLSGFDNNLIRASASLGADPVTTFFRVTLPLVAPGMISGALFAFAASFDEVVTVLFLGGPEQRTIPRQMWSGIREQISPTILAVATLLIVFSTLLLLTVEMLRRWNAPAKG
ncbi:MAG: ABC transporter permease [Alphaproteobacteria bacterium]|jgi:putative spermidine/putrescine transport system permease protein|nr:ABC transporter permease [Alphaproteobacteria bacterium]